VTALDLAAVAHRQNDRDYAAGLLPSRHVTDEAVLHQVAAILHEHRQAAGRPEAVAGDGRAA
jgi:hypothetical protein